MAEIENPIILKGYLKRVKFSPDETGTVWMSAAVTPGRFNTDGLSIMVKIEEREIPSYIRMNNGMVDIYGKWSLCDDRSFRLSPESIAPSTVGVVAPDVPK